MVRTRAIALFPRQRAGGICTERPIRFTWFSEQVRSEINAGGGNRNQEDEAKKGGC
jgi:hypothetical protein